MRHPKRAALLGQAQPAAMEQLVVEAEAELEPELQQSTGHPHEGLSLESEAECCLVELVRTPS